MLYLEYIEYKHKYNEAQKAVSMILDEKTVLFQKTQPKSPLSDTERVDGGTPRNKVEEYVIAMEQRRVNERLAEAKTLMLERLDMLRQKELELRASKAKYDEVYVLKYLEHMSISEIAYHMKYSESQVYRIHKKVRKNINMIENERK